jgi:hypothetical protein
MENAVACRENYGVLNFEEYAMSVESVVRQVNLVQEIMKGVMKDGEHYGVIPGTSKPSLYKPGAEKLGFTFRLAPEYEVTTIDWPGGHREYQVKCKLRHIPTGTMVGEGVGTCTTLEGKYRYRGGEKEGTGQPVPKEYWNLKNAGRISEALNLIGGEGFGVGKIDGQWQICSMGEKVEHDNPADYYNTCEKMAKKRAHVDAILTATAASDIFTQDVEDMPEVIPGAAEAAKKTETQKEPIKAPQKKQTEVQNPDDPATENQIKAIQAILTTLKVTDDLEKHQTVSAILGMKEVLTSFTVLTKGQASAAIKQLSEDADAKRQGDGK